MSFRVLHCLWHGEIGGAERAVEQLVRAQLGDPEIEPAVLFGQPGGLYWERAQELGCPVVTLELPHGHALSSLPSSAAAMQGFDVHHFHSPEVSLMLSSLLCRGVRRVYTHRGGFTDYPPKARIRNAFAGALLRRGFHAYSGNTVHAADSAARLFKLPREKIVVTYNGLQFELLRPNRPAEEVVRELGLSGTSFVIGTAANLKPWKRVDRLVLAVKNLRNPRLHLLIVGGGVDRSRLERLVADSGVGTQVTFAGSQDHVADYLQVMDAFCLPSAGLESFGNALVEAMGLGLPAIVFRDGGGMVEHIDDGRTGFIVGSQAELEERLSQLLEDPALGNQIGVAAKEEVRARYTPELATAAYRLLYEVAFRG
jgi:glycosyltransferase involved in cell wall biosynthesis